MQKNQLALIKPKWNVTIATRQVILLESVDSRELKITGGGTHGILETRMGAELDKRRILKSMITLMEKDGWTNHSEDEIRALMACNSSDSDTEVMSCSNKCKESYVNLKKLYDAQREQLSDASIEIKAYSQGHKKVKHSLVARHQQENIEEYESDSEDECVSIPTKQQETPSFTNQQVKTTRENVKSQFTHSQKPKVDKKDIGHGFTVRACFVCGSVNHLIRDCDFHKKRMARKAVLNNGWNNVQRVNKQNQFVPSAVLTRTGIIPVNTARTSGTKNFSTARQSVNRQTVLTSTAMKVNTVKPIVNRVRPANVFHKTHSPSSRPFKKTTVLRPKFSNQKFNTAKDYPHRALKNKGIVDSGCSRHMTGNKAYLAEFQDFNGGPVAFGGSKGYITGKGKIKTGKLDFEDVCFVKELQHFNLFSVSQMCDKKNKVLFTDSECLVLSSEFKLPDENQVLLKIPRQNNMYSFNLENIVPSGGLACLIAKATTDESNKWHRRLGHVNFKNLNKLVKGNLVRAGSENRPPMLNKENYVPWSSRLLRYAKSRPNGKLIYNSIMNGPYVRRMIPEPGDADREVPVLETFHEQTDDELTVAEIKQMEADDQAIQTILLAFGGAS
ncbi:ribonuclease H-like domain-containing protein [Tanacetum coccineum]